MPLSGRSDDMNFAVVRVGTDIVVAYGRTYPEALTNAIEAFANE